MRVLFPVLLFFSATAPIAPALASDGPWQVDGDRIVANGAGVALPQTVAGLSLTKSGEIPAAQEALNSYARYESEDGAIQATAYVYRPDFADASVAAYVTDRAIVDRFGAATHRIQVGTRDAATRPDTAIRSVYSAADGALVTAAAFVQAGAWLVKLRITGPADRAAEVEAGLDGLLDGFHADQPTLLRTADARPFQACEKTGAATGAYCVRGQVIVGEDAYDMLQPAADSQSDPSSVVIPLDDAGRVMRFTRNDNRGYRLLIQDVGKTEGVQDYDRLPSSTQIARLINASESGDDLRLALRGAGTSSALK